MGPGGLVIRNRRWRASASLRPAGRAERDRGARHRSRSGRRAHGCVAERDTRSLVERLSAPVFVPPPDSQGDLMRKYRVTAEQASGAARTWPGCLPKTRLTGTCFRPAIGCPVEVEAFPGREHNDLVLWIERHRAVIAGDTLVDLGRGLEIPAEWLRQGVTREQNADGLRPLLELPVDVVLATHGGPTDWTALERALS